MFGFFRKRNLNKVIEDTHIIILNYINVIKLSRSNGELPAGFWKDDYIIAYFATLIGLIFNSATRGDSTREERGSALMVVFEKLCPEDSQEVLSKFNALARSPTDDWERGNINAANVFGVMHGILKPEFENDPDIIKAKEIAPKLKSQSLELGNESDDRSSVTAALSNIYMVEYVNEKFRNN